MKRRAFLKFLGLGSGVIAVGAGLPSNSLKFALPEFPSAAVVSKRLADAAPEGLTKVRELCQYLINTDQYVVRYDILLPSEQYHVVFQSPTDNSRFNREVWLEQNRPIARDALSQVLRDKGLTWADVRRAPLPDGIAHTRYI